RVRAEIATLRQQWLDECNRHREELVQQGEQLQTARTAFEAEQSALEAVRQSLQKEQALAAAQGQELARQRGLFAADCDIFEKTRETFETGRTAETERLTSWETGLTARDQEAGRREEVLRVARTEFEQEYAQFQEERDRLDPRMAAVEEG